MESLQTHAESLGIPSESPRNPCVESRILLLGQGILRGPTPFIGFLKCIFFQKDSLWQGLMCSDVRGWWIARAIGSRKEEGGRKKEEGAHTESLGIPAASPRNPCVESHIFLLG